MLGAGKEVVARFASQFDGPYVVQKSASKNIQSTMSSLEDQQQDRSSTMENDAEDTSKQRNDGDQHTETSAPTTTTCNRDANVATQTSMFESNSTPGITTCANSNEDDDSVTPPRSPRGSMMMLNNNRAQIPSFNQTPLGGQTNTMR